MKGEQVHHDVFTKWTLSDILNEKYLKENAKGPIRDSFSTAKEWATTFKPFILEEIRHELNDCMVNLDQCQSIQCKVATVEANGISIEFRILNSIIQPHLKEAKKDINKGVTLFNTYALLIHQPPALVRLSTLSNLQHMLCHLDSSIEQEEEELKGEEGAIQDENDLCVVVRGRVCFGNVHNNVPINGWECIFFNVSTLVPRRAWEALGSLSLPSFQSDLLTGESPFASAACEISRHNDHFLARLNDSQRVAVEGVLKALKKESPPIRIIKGPPGTGKTSTLVALLHSLRAKNYRVHVTAQSNIAVMELAARYYRDILNMRHEANIGESDVPMPHLRAADMLIVGVAGKYETDANLQRLVFSLRECRVKSYAIQLYLLKQMMLTAPHIIDSSRDGKKKLPSFASYFRDEIVSAIDLFDMQLDECLHDAICSQHLAALEELKNLRNSVIGLPDQLIMSWRSLEGNVSADHTIEVMRNRIYELLCKLPQKPDCGSPIDDVNILFSTVSTAGTNRLRRQNFDVVIIDEAAQLVESHIAIVVKPTLNCLVLAGDDKQLPPTVISHSCKSAGYSRSLFERLLQRGYPKTLLNVQYRMHPHISQWPNATFYDGLISNGENVMSASYKKPWHDRIPPFSLFDVKGVEEQSSEGSWFNEIEAKIVKQMLHMVNNVVREPCAVGVISPYSAQTTELRNLETAGMLNNNCRVTVKSVDGYQGQECDIVILCTVRSNDRNDIGFLRDVRRLNVALTRSKYALIVICNATTFSKHPVWRELINYSKNACTYQDTKSHVVIKKVMNNHNALIQHMHTLIQSTSSLFEELPWKITFCVDFKNAIDKIAKSALNKIFQCIILLGQGKWSGRSAIDDSSLRVAKIQDHRLVWSVDINQSTREQYIKVWSVISFDKLSVTLKRISGSMTSWTDQYIALCRETRYEASSKCHVPIKFPSGLDIEWYKKFKNDACTTSNQESSFSEGADNATSLMKFYPLTSGVASLFLQTDTVRIDLPFVMSEDEDELVKYKGSLLILGRSGTGKTTVMLHRMLLESIYLHKVYGGGNDVKQTSAPPEYAQLMVTASSVLCAAIHRSYDNMYRSAKLTDNTISLPERDVSDETIESFSAENRMQSPIIITYSKFLRLLDKTLTQPFFAAESIVSDDNRDIIVPRFRRRSVEVDYEYFSANYYPRFNQNLKIDCSTVYMEIMSHIKGSVAALHTSGGYISLDEYINLSETRQSTLTPSQRQHIYEAYERYEELKSSTPEVYDCADVVHYIYKSLVATPYSGRKMISVYIDEVQDLSPAQISLFQFVCQNPNGFVFAGDTAQTIAHGVGFRFETLKDIFYHEYLRISQSLPAAELAALLELMPKLKFLSRNFRTHTGIVNIARSIVDLIVRFFPHTIDKMDPETSHVPGQPPMFITSDTDVILDLFADGTMHSTEFGAEQAILVRDDKTKRAVKDICGNKALVLTVLEAKGMEFTDCLIYNFFDSCPLKNDWRVILEECADKTEKFTKFDPQKHSGLCVELKLLYVLLTRTRQRLMIYDRDRATAGPMLKLWQERKLIVCQPFNEDIRHLFAQTSSPEEWSSRGEDFFERKQYGNAKMCYLRAGDEYHERLCTAAEHEQEANRHKHNYLYIDAATEYEALGDRTADAARCFRLGGAYDRAAPLFLQLQEWNNAGECYHAGGLFSSAADAYFRGGSFNNVVQCCYEGNLYDKLIILCEQATRQESFQIDATAIKSACARKGALYFHKTHNIESMMHMVRCMNTIEDTLSFLRKYDYHEQVLEILLEHGKYTEAAEVYLLKSKLMIAADYYEQGGNIEASLACYMRHIRLLACGNDFDIDRNKLKKHKNLIKKIEPKAAQHKKYALELALFNYEMIPSDVRSLQQIEESYQLANQLDNNWRLKMYSLKLLIQQHFVKSSINETYTALRDYVEIYFALIAEVAGIIDCVGTSGKIHSSQANAMDLVFEYFNAIMRKSLWGYSIAVDCSCIAVKSYFLDNKEPNSTKCKLDLKPFCQKASAYLRSSSLDFRKRIIKDIGKAINDTSPNPLFAANVNFFVLHLSENIRQTDKVIYDLSLHASNQIVDFVSSNHIRWNDKEVFASARYHPELKSLIEVHCTTHSTFRQPQLRIEVIAKALLLGSIVGSTAVPARLEKICNSELHKRVKKGNFATDNRMRLVHAFRWEHATVESPLRWSKNPFVYSLVLGTQTIIHEGYRGSISAVLWNENPPANFYREKDGTLTLPTYLSLCEKYVVWWMLIWKGCGNVIIPASMLMDVVYRKTPAYVEMIKGCAKIRGEVPDHSTVNLRREALSMLVSLFKLLLEFIEHLCREDIDAWVKLESSKATHLLQHPSFSSIQYKLLVLPFTMLINMNREMQRSFGPRLLKTLQGSCIFKELNDSKNLRQFAVSVSSGNVLRMLKTYVAAENDKLIAIDCRHEMSPSNNARAAKLDLFILEAHDEVIEIHSHNPNVGSSREEVQQVFSESQHELMEEECNKDAFEECGAASVAPPEIIDEVPWQNGPVGTALKRVAAIYLHRRAKRTPKQWFMKEITKEFAKAFKMKLCASTKKAEYINVCESVWKLRQAYITIENYVSEFKDSSDVAIAEAVDSIVDTVHPLEQAIQETSPEYFFMDEHACEKSVTMRIDATTDILVNAMQEIAEKISNSDVKAFANKVSKIVASDK